HARIGVHLLIEGLVDNTKGHAGIRALERHCELFERPQHLLHVDRVSASPDLEHRHLPSGAVSGVPLLNRILAQNATRPKTKRGAKSCLAQRAHPEAQDDSASKPIDLRVSPRTRAGACNVAVWLHPSVRHAPRRKTLRGLRLGSACACTSESSAPDRAMSRPRASLAT